MKTLLIVLPALAFLALTSCTTVEEPAPMTTTTTHTESTVTQTPTTTSTTVTRQSAGGGY